MDKILLTSDTFGQSNKNMILKDLDKKDLFSFKEDLFFLICPICNSNLFIFTTKTIENTYQIECYFCYSKHVLIYMFIKWV